MPRSLPANNIGQGKRRKRLCWPVRPQQWTRVCYTHANCSTRLALEQCLCNTRRSRNAWHALSLISQLIDSFSHCFCSVWCPFWNSFSPWKAMGWFLAQQSAQYPVCACCTAWTMSRRCCRDRARPHSPQSKGNRYGSWTSTLTPRKLANSAGWQQLRHSLRYGPCSDPKRFFRPCTAMPYETALQGHRTKPLSVNHAVRGNSLLQTPGLSAFSHPCSGLLSPAIAEANLPMPMGKRSHYHAQPCAAGSSRCPGPTHGLRGVIAPS